MPHRQPLEEPGAAPTSGVGHVARRWAAQIAVVIIAAAALLLGLVWLGNYAREQIRDRERFQLPFGEIECHPPPPMEVGDFLEEVLYLSGMPAYVSTMDGRLPQRLEEAFLKHPWVAHIEKVDVAQPRAIRLALIYRQAVMAVEVTADLIGDGSLLPGRSLRAVDSGGILLPKKANTDGLPVFHGAPRPIGGAGKPWGDSGVKTAAQVAAVLYQHQATLGIADMAWSQDGLVLYSEKAKFLWGQSSTSSGPLEASASVKEQRLLQVNSTLRPMPPWLPARHYFDLRPSEGFTRQLAFPEIK